MEHVRSKKKLTPPIIAGIVAGASVLVLAGAYCGLCAWVSGNGRLLPGTIAQNQTQTVTLDLGGLTQDAAVEYMTSSMKEHLDTLQVRTDKLNELRLESLHYTNSLGTDLTIRLPEDHLWAGGGDRCKAGHYFIANMPTEEIFTAPRWDGVNGRVYAAMPLALNGNLVRDFHMDFENGKIVNVHAGEGEEYLRNSVGMDEGAAYLGEVALVPYDSPIRNSGILFYNTLFDENASCHLAYGSAYPNCVKGGEDLSEADQKAAGLNQSMTHVDFMVGTRDLSIVGTTQDGREIPVFVDGNFAF